MRALMDDRNVGMVAQIKRYLAGQGTYFVLAQRGRYVYGVEKLPDTAVVDALLERINENLIRGEMVEMPVCSGLSGKVNVVVPWRQEQHWFAVRFVMQPIVGWLVYWKNRVHTVISRTFRYCPDRRRYVNGFRLFRVIKIRRLRIKPKTCSKPAFWSKFTCSRRCAGKLQGHQ